ncbi:MAG: hypothetical protein GX045_06250 [Clostridiaceae bacterium]|nr:hypothetical protein [Clostridiaceae bacterium]
MCFLPVLSAYYYGDDATSHYIKTFMHQENRTLFQYILTQMDYYILQVGRFYPAHIWHRFLTFYIFDTIELYRLFNLVMNALALYSFAFMVKTFSDSKKLYYAVLLFFPAVFFFLTRYDDAITSYYMFIQMLVVYLSFSLILLKKYISTGKRWYLAVSLVLYILSLLTYESSYPLLLVYPLAVFYLSDLPVKERLKKSITGSMPYIIAAIVCFGIYIYFSINATAEYHGIHFNLDVKRIIVTFFKQVIAAFPVVPHACLIFDNQFNFRFDFNNAINNVTVLDLVTAIIFTSLLILFYKRYRNEDVHVKGKRFLIFLSILLVVCPSLIISVSIKYQQGLIWGLGYLTIYITRFGLLILGFFAYEKIISAFREGFLRNLANSAIVCILIFVHLFSLQGNRNVLYHKNQATHARLLAEQAIDAGLLDGIPENSIIYLGNIWYDFPSFSRNKIFSEACGARVITDTMRNFIDESFKNTGEPRTYLYNDYNVYYFHFNKFLSNTGYAFSAKLNTLSVDEKNITEMTGENFKLFYSGEECSAVDIAVWDGEDFVIKRFPLVPYKYRTYVAEVPGVVDLESINLVNKVKASLWEPE